MDGQDHELICRDVRLTAVVYQHGCTESGTGRFNRNMVRGQGWWAALRFLFLCSL